MQVAHLNLVTVLEIRTQLTQLIVQIPRQLLPNVPRLRLSAQLISVSKESVNVLLLYIIMIVITQL